MKRLIFVVILFLAIPVMASAQVDPLSPGYSPAINTNPANYPANIWITDTMQKVRQDTGSPGTQHWGTFYGTQNEFVDFQVHLHDTGSGTPNLTITTSDFVQSAPSSFTISAASTNIIVYREAYMNVTGHVTATSSTYYGVQGYYPDILIPTVDPYWHQTTNAWPFNVAAGKNQSAWIDILIPQNAPAGYYLGSVIVKSGTTTLATMPVVLAVWQWPSSRGGYMPSTTSLKQLGPGPGYNSLCIQLYQGDGSTTNTGVCSGYPDSGGAGDGAITRIQLDYGLLMKDHRFASLGAAQNIFAQSGSFSTYVSLAGPLLNGGCLHNGKACPLLSGSKNRTMNLSFYGGASAAIFNNYLTNFNANGWTDVLFYYLCDEPNPPGGGVSFLTCVANGTTYHTYSNPAIPQLITTDLASATAAGGLNAIDWMVPIINYLDPIGGSSTRSNYNTWLSGSSAGVKRELFTYQSCSSSGTCSNGIVGSGVTYPNYNVDGYPAANRAMEWMSFRLNVLGELYYAADICMSPNGQGPYCGTGSQTPFTNIYYSGGWGDGTLVYAGCAGSICAGKPSYMGPGVTTPIILPSVRLKHLRDGVQDYEYLNVLTNVGKGAAVTAQINSWITNSYTFEMTGTGLQTARIALGTALHQLTYQSLLQPPPKLTGTLQ